MLINPDCLIVMRWFFFISELQSAFDKDVQTGCITRDDWFPNATDEGILAYKLLIQTGDIDNPFDKDLVGVLMTNCHIFWFYVCYM